MTDIVLNVNKASVDTPCKAYGKMSDDWSMINDLLGGTDAMRLANQKWLPREAAETYGGYQHRLASSFFYNGLQRTIDMLVGKPFSEDVHVAKEISADADASEWMEDLDKQGNDVTTVARHAFRIGCAKGMVHFLTEYPAVNDEYGKPRRISLAEKARNNIRPYICVIDPENVIGWQYVIENGKPVLTQLRIKEVATVQVGDWGEKDVNRVRVFDRIVVNGVSVVGWRLFEEQKDMQGNTTWVVVASGYTTTGYIPLATAYFGEKLGVLQARIPLIDLAWMNVEHWQSMSDQRHILHVARVPVWLLTGYDETEDENGNKKDKIVLGPDRMIRLSNPDADLKVVEHKGDAINAGRLDIQDIEARMATMGVELLKKKTKGEVTATEAGHDNVAEDCDLAAMVKALEDALTTAIGFMYEWEGRVAPKGKLVTINTDFGLSTQDAADLQVLYQSRMAGLVSQATYLKELQRRKVLAPSVQLDAEVAAAKTDGPVLLPQAAGPSSSDITNKSGAGA